MPTGRRMNGRGEVHGRDGSAGAPAGTARRRRTRAREPVEGQVDDRGGVEGQQLAHDEAAHDRDAERPAQLGAHARAERQRQPPSSAAIVVIMIGRKRSRQAW